MKYFISKNGRIAAIFFLIATQAAAQSVVATQVQVINRGLLEEGFWRNQSLRGKVDRVVGLSDVGIQFEAPLANQAWGIALERRTISTLSSNFNTLTLSARSGADQADLDKRGLALSAQTKRYEFDALSLLWRDQIPGASLKWKLAPKWVRLRDVRELSGMGRLDRSDENLSLNATLDRRGTNSYGFEAEPSEANLSHGASLDAGVTWESGLITLDIQASNLFSRIPSNTVFFSDRTYQVNSSTQGIVFNDVPSLSGTYGHRRVNLALPRLVKSEISYTGWSTGVRPKAGIFMVDGHAISWVGLLLPMGRHEFELRNFELNNTQFTYRALRPFDGPLSAEMTLIRDTSGSYTSLLGSLMWAY